MYIFITMYDSAPGIRRGWAKTYAAPLLHIQVRRRRSRFKDLAFLAIFWHLKTATLGIFVWKWFSFSGDGEPILCCVQKHSPIHSTSCYCAFYRWPLLIIHSFLNFEGPLSDRYGRIPALLFSLVMNCLCYTGDRKSHYRQVNVKEKFTAWPKASYFLHVVCWYPPGCRF